MAERKPWAVADSALMLDMSLMRPAPPAPRLPKDSHGKPIVALLACHTGRPEEGEQAVVPIKTFGAPIGDVLYVAGSWEHADDDETNIKWARQAWNDMKQFSTGGAYINFMTEDEGPERIEAALGRALRRLAEIKTRWDPQNVFHTNRNIKPV